MDAKTTATATRNDGTRYMWIGFALGLACMVALFIAGLVEGSAGMVVMASSTAAALAAVWSSTAVAAAAMAVSSTTDHPITAAASSRS